MTALGSAEIPAEFLSDMADLTNHRIEGIARMGGKRFSCPLVTQVEGNLWQGGCPEQGVPAYFRYVLNLYPWVGYPVPDGVEVRRVELYDDASGVPTELVYELAAWVNEKRRLGPTLVHCQAGLNRSALVTALALTLCGMNPPEAIAMLREKRSPAVLSNANFEGWLRAQRCDPTLGTHSMPHRGCVLR